jgi:hypothetical protein
MRGRCTVVLTIPALVGGLLVAGCSGPTSGHAGSTTPAPRIVATFEATDSASPEEKLIADAHVVAVRLHAFGDNGAFVVERRHSVVVMGTSRLPIPASLLLVAGTFQVRPALCATGAPVAPTSNKTPPPLPTTCSSGRYSLQAPNLTVNTSTGTSNLPSIAPDPTLAVLPSSSPAYDDSHPGNSVLIPVSGGGDGGPSRYLLGPAVLNGSAVAKARATFVDPQWVVDVTLTAPGATAWDDAARTYFHQLLAMEVDGMALSVPLVQPNSPTFVSFDGQLQVSGNFTRKTATQLAAVLSSGPLVTPLQG